MTTRLRSPRPSALWPAGEELSGSGCHPEPTCRLSRPRSSCARLPASALQLEHHPGSAAVPFASEASRATRSSAVRQQDFAMAGARGLLCLWLGYFCLNLAQGQRPNLHLPGLRETEPRDLRTGGSPSPDLPPHDKVSEHMLWLYDRYSGSSGVQATGTPGSQLPGPQPLRGGNTVRSFRAAAAGEWEGEEAHPAPGCRGQPLPPCHSAVSLWYTVGTFLKCCPPVSSALSEFSRGVPDKPSLSPAETGKQKKSWDSGRA